MEEGKKISFGFNKPSKKPTNVNKPQEKKIDFVECLEGQSIKLKNEIKVVEKEPLVIPLRDNKKDLLDRVRDMKAKQKNKAESTQEEDIRPDSMLTENEIAAREVLREAKLRLAQGNIADNKLLVLPLTTKDTIPLEGEKESTLDDYGNVPVTDFGLAMLRGMGWKEGVGIGRNPNKTALVKPPELRPKGLGLGASALHNSESQNKAPDKNGEILVLKKGSFAKIIAGNHKGNYCEVQGLDDEAGRVVVKTALKGEVLALNEFTLVAITKDEFLKNSRVLNSAKFNEYKEEEQRKTELNEKYKRDKDGSYKSKKIVKKEISDSVNEEAEFYNKNDMKNIKTEKKNDYSGNLDSKSYPGNSKKDESTRHTKRFSDDSTSSDNNYDKSRKTHKRKDKKSHRDKSRSPYRSNYKSSKKSSKSKQKHRYRSSDSESDYEYRHRSRRNNSDDHRHRRNKN